MAKELNSWGLVLQSNTPSSNSEKDGRLSLTLDGKKFSFQIDGPEDQKRVYLLMNNLLGEDASWDAFHHLVRIVCRYDLKETFKMLKHIDEEGLMWEVIGDSNLSSDPKTAVDAYLKASRNDNICGLCKYGRCLAEGRGCQQDKALARRSLIQASRECIEADHFLDWYGLR
jgi:TPR repeat protein